MKRAKPDYHRLTHALVMLLAMLACICAINGDYASAAGLFMYAAVFSIILQ